MSHYPHELLTLIAYLKKLPGVGRKTAERFAFSLLNWEKPDIKKFSNHLSELQEKIHTCLTCNCLKDTNYCNFCDPKTRDSQLLCLVSSPKDVYAIEETKVFKGVYHVLGGLLSPLEGRSIEHLNLVQLEKRFLQSSIQEVVIAFDSTLEGDATALFMKQYLDTLGIKTTRLAFGLPMGSALDFVDFGTLEKAFTGRHIF